MGCDKIQYDLTSTPRLNQLLSLACVFTIVLSGLGGYGISFYLGFPYTPVHSVLPFVILGLGVQLTLDIF